MVKLDIPHWPLLWESVGGECRQEWVDGVRAWGRQCGVARRADLLNLCVVGMGLARRRDNQWAKRCARWYGWVDSRGARGGWVRAAQRAKLLELRLVRLGLTRCHVACQRMIVLDKAA